MAGTLAGGGRGGAGARGGRRRQQLRGDGRRRRRVRGLCTHGHLRLRRPAGWGSLQDAVGWRGLSVSPVWAGA
ncbi:hypothetical protein SFR_1425 [Streptomyces sp. FR-008]|nr:hypothetical protein SFR_1425 [Streptomyces sp. FR-008]